MSNAIRVFDSLLEVTVLLQQDLARSFDETGLTLARTHLLWELRRLGPCPQQALAAALGVSARNVTGLVDALESTGFVARSPHPTDRRATLVALTEQGVSTMDQMARDRMELSERLVERLTPADVEHLSTSLAAVTDRLRELVEAAAQPTEPT